MSPHIIHYNGTHAWGVKSCHVPIFTLFVISCEKKLNSHWIMEIVEFYIMSKIHREKILRKLTPQIHGLSENEIVFFPVVILSPIRIYSLFVIVCAAINMHLFICLFICLSTLVSGTSHGRRNLELDMKPGCAPRPPEWLYTWLEPGNHKSQSKKSQINCLLQTCQRLLNRHHSIKTLRDRQVSFIFLQ